MVLKCFCVLHADLLVILLFLSASNLSRSSSNMRLVGNSHIPWQDLNSRSLSLSLSLHLCMSATVLSHSHTTHDALEANTLPYI